MSADNGIYVLRSPIHHDMPSEFEYRVAHAMAIDNIWYKPDKDGFNMQQVKDYFGGCMVFRSRTEALLKADKIAKDCVILEYGIQFINIPFPFPEQ